jgi:DNA invertase Pin-like site-specific DNA recombinase
MKLKRALIPGLQREPEIYRVALYARISTREGQQHQANQLNALRTYAKQMLWQVVAEYSDAITGASTRRPQLDELMAAAARREFDAVVVFDLSRLTRGGPAKAFEYIARLKASKVEFWSMHEEHFRTAGIYGDLFIAIAAHIAEMERATMRARIQAGLATARRNGVALGRKWALLDLKQLAEYRRAGKSLREISKLTGVSHVTIQRRLVNKNHATPHGTRSK